MPSGLHQLLQLPLKGHRWLNICRCQTAGVSRQLWTSDEETWKEEKRKHGLILNSQVNVGVGDLSADHFLVSNWFKLLAVTLGSILKTRKCLISLPF